MSQFERALHQCQSKTTKRAWRNPLAPMATCVRDAKMTLKGSGGKLMNVCTLHGKKLLEYGWTKVTP